jgi:3-oxoacyl-[acyl-carrier-protein] synthase III
MSAQEIRDKTGIQQRLYTERGLEDIALEAAKAALDKAGRSPEDVGAVLFCSCTSTRLIPSVATWLSGELGMFQTHASCDLVAACAGLPYGLAEAVRLLQEVERPVLLVCAEKFSDKIGSVRTSRMIFGDGAAAVVMAPAVDGEPPDVEVVQTYAGGPVSEVNSIIWPNPAFDNNITVYGPEVRRLVERYLMQMMAELQTLPGPAGEPTMLAAIDLIVPHQANKTMVVTLAEAAGISPDQLYFNIERMGNVSSASIPLAIHDAVADGVIDRPMLVFAPGFGAGAVGGYAILRIDPAIVAVSAGPSGPAGPSGTSAGATPTMVAVAPAWATSSDDVQAAFGG